MAYSPVEWNTGDVITAAKLNNMDGGIIANEEAINDINTKVAEIGDANIINGATINIDVGDNNLTSIALDYGTYIISETVVVNRANQGFAISLTTNNVEASKAPMYHTDNSSMYGSLQNTVIAKVGSGGGSINFKLTIPGTTSISGTTCSYYFSYIKIK